MSSTNVFGFAIIQKNWVEYDFEYFPLHKDFNGIGVNFNVLLYYFITVALSY